MESPGREFANRALVARIAGLLGIVIVAVNFLPGSLGGPLFDNVSAPQILDWARHSGATITLDGFIAGVSASMVAAFVIALVVATAGRGLLAILAIASAAAFMAIDWAHAGVYFALADAGRRVGADAGVVALFSLTKAMTFADGFVFGLAVLAVSLAAMRSRTLPAPVVGLGLLVGGYHLVAIPIQLSINGSAGGLTGPVSVVTSLLWVLATSVILLIKPLWGEQRTSSPAPAG